MEWRMTFSLTQTFFSKKKTSQWMWKVGVVDFRPLTAHFQESSSSIDRREIVPSAPSVPTTASAVKEERSIAEEYEKLVFNFKNFHNGENQNGQSKSFKLPSSKVCLQVPSLSILLFTYSPQLWKLLSTVRLTSLELN
jgi:hypothetical protein